jgi:hypothetical protein
VRDEIWRAAGMPEGQAGGPDGISTVGGGILCVGCIEKRLGRLLTKQDFNPLTLKLFETACECTPRLLSRVGIAHMNIAHLPLPDRIVERWAGSILLKALREQHRGIRDVEVTIESRARIKVSLVYADEAVPYRAGPRLREFVDGIRADRPELGEVDLEPWEEA